MAPNVSRPNRSSQSRRSRSGHTQEIPKSRKRKRDEDDVEALNQQVAEFDSTTAPTEFTELPLSSSTQDGLASSHFKKLTAIQSKAIPTALKGGDILGAAKTGSGKTLAFLIPVLENLYRKNWTEFDGLGALILSPTRELAIQIFEVLRKVGRNHTFSAGLIIGGKSLKEERERLYRMNILVATPGRMLQHMDQASELEIGSLQMLVLDEADRIMDMGFKDTVDAIVEHLPQDRQTMLFSATQTKRVSDLARLSLKEPEFVSVHEAADSATPSTLQQNYVITPLPEKLDTLWSFIRANLKKKILVFLSSGKQVRFVYEALRHLQPGLSLLHLHGRQKQTARLDVTTKFSNSKHACLFATDIAARGLDFPAVDWVVQVDCPEDPETYIHRVGRTARYEHDGRAILLLDPSEEDGMLKALARKKVILEKINVRQKKMQNSIRNQLQNMCFKDPELKYLGQKAFVSYVRSVHVQKDKDIFKVKELDLEAFAASLGLPGAPRVKFVKGEDAKIRKNAPRQLLAASSGSEDEGDVPKAQKDKDRALVRTKYDRMFERQNQDVLAEHYIKMIDTDQEEDGMNGGSTDADEDNDFLSVKRRFDAGDEALGETPHSSVDAVKLKRPRIAKASNSNSDSDSDSDSPDSDPEPDPTPTHHKSKPDSKPNPPISTLHKVIQLSSDPTNILVVDSKRREKLLKSKKALAKLKPRGTHTVFDDADIPHNKVGYIDEAAFRAEGDAAAQRERFVRAERERAERADVEDKAVAKRKRRERIERRKERERAEAMDDGEDGGAGGGGGRVVYLGGAEEGEDDGDGRDLDELETMAEGLLAK